MEQGGHGLVQQGESARLHISTGKHTIHLGAYYIGAAAEKQSFWPAEGHFRLACVKAERQKDVLS